MSLPSVHGVVAPGGHHPFSRMFFSSKFSHWGKHTNIQLSILLHSFFSSNILAMLLWRVTCFHQNLTCKTKAYSKGMCVTHHKVKMLYTCVQLATPPLSCQVFGPFSACIRFLKRVCSCFCACYVGQLKRGNLWVMVMGWAPYGLFLLDCSDHSYTQHALIP
jgi:hypothetical protein